MSNARSPREVCSITIGINGLIASPLNFACFGWSFQRPHGQSPFGLRVTPHATSPWLLAAGGPQFRLGRGRILVGGPDALARARDLGGDALHLARDPVERLAQSKVAAERLVATALEDLLDRLVGVVAVQVGLLPDQLLDLLVGNLQAELVRHRLEHELAPDGALRLGAQALNQLVAGLPGELQVGVRADPAALQRADEGVQQLARSGLDEGARGLDARRLDERVDRVGTEGGLRLLFQQVADALLDVGSQFVERVELARGTRQVVVERREHLLLQFLERDGRLDGRAVRLRQLHVLRLTGLSSCERALDLFDEASTAQLDDEIALPFALVVEDVDDDDVTGAGGPILDRRQLRDGRAQLLELRVDDILRHLWLRVADLELGPVGRLGLRLDGDGGDEAE